MDEDQNLDALIDDEEELDQSSNEEQLDEEQAGDDQDQSEEDAESGDSQDEEVQEQKPSRRENLRIQQIIRKAQEGGYNRPTPQSPQDALDYRKALNADDQVLDTLEADRKSYGDKMFETGLKRAEAIQFHTRLEIDAPAVANKFQQLNKDSEEFNPAVADAINSQYLFMVGYDPKTDTVANPSIRYKDFVEGIMELAEVAATRKVQSASKNIAKQAASTGLRPDGSSAKRLNLNKAPEAMTDEELDAIIAQAVPKRR